MHPFVLHATSQNVLRAQRLITNPPLSLRAPLRFDREDPADHSPVERAVLRGLGAERYPFTPSGRGRPWCPAAGDGPLNPGSPPAGDGGEPGSTPDPVRGSGCRPSPRRGPRDVAAVVGGEQHVHRASSAGCPGRPSGTCWPNVSTCSGGIVDGMSGSTRAGATLLTRMPRSPSSCAIEAHMFAIPALVTE